MLSKAGVIPYIVEDNQIKMNFYISSDPKFGGALPQVGKGMIDPGEDLLTAALREGNEELGLLDFNIIDHDLYLKHAFPSYNLHVFGVFVKHIDDFQEPHFEARGTVWMTLKDFKIRGRKFQLNLVERMHLKIKHKLGCNI